MPEPSRETEYLHHAEQVLEEYGLDPFQIYFAGGQSIVGKEPQVILTLPHHYASRASSEVHKMARGS